MVMKNKKAIDEKKPPTEFRKTVVMKKKKKKKPMEEKEKKPMEEKEQQKKMMVIKKKKTMAMKKKKKPMDEKEEEKEKKKTPSEMWRMWRSKGPIFRSKEERILAYKESAKINPFEARGFTRRCGARDLMEYICNDRFTCPLKVLLYAKMGLHRHNLLKDTNYELDHVRKYNVTFGLPPVHSYFITSVAKDPSSSSSLTFLTAVNEQACGRYVLTCYIARPQEATPTPTKSEYISTDSVPECPPQNPFRNTDGFYLLKKSELQDNAWIRLYLELAIATTSRDFGLPDHGLSHLKIVKVPMEDENKEGLYANNAVFYIGYKDSLEARVRVGKDVGCIAIVRRAFNERTGCFSLVGMSQISDFV